MISTHALNTILISRKKREKLEKKTNESTAIFSFYYDTSREDRVLTEEELLCLILDSDLLNTDELLALLSDVNIRLLGGAASTEIEEELIKGGFNRTQIGEILNKRFSLSIDVDKTITRFFKLNRNLHPGWFYAIKLKLSNLGGVKKFAQFYFCVRQTIQKADSTNHNHAKYVYKILKRICACEIKLKE